jgi:hypothetical protein
MNPPPDYDGTNIAWSELNRWAMRRHPGWQHAMHTAERQGMTEAETLRLLAHTLLTECCDRHNQQMQAVAHGPFTFVVPAAPAKIINTDDPFES